MAAEGNNQQDVIDDDDDDDDELSAIFFPEGGKKDVRKQLTEVVRRIRLELKMEPGQLDELCGFGKEAGLPTCDAFEREPDLMNQRVFCRAACALDIEISDALSLDWSGDRMPEVIKRITDSDLRMAALPAGTAGKSVPIEKMAPVFAAFKILSEI